MGTNLLCGFDWGDFCNVCIPDPVVCRTRFQPTCRFLELALSTPIENKSRRPEKLLGPSFGEFPLLSEDRLSPKLKVKDAQQKNQAYDVCNDDHEFAL